MDMVHPGEEALRENLRQARKAAAKQSRRSLVRDLWSRLFHKAEPVSRDLVTLDHLKRQLAEARHERDQARDELAMLRLKPAVAPQAEVDAKETTPSEEMAEALSKARAYDELAHHLPVVAGWTTALSRVSDRLILRSVVREMHGELSSARDGFQKIKIYRKYLGRLAAFPQLETTLAPFLVDRNLVKDRKRMEGLVEELRRATDVAQDLEPLLEDADTLLRLQNALRPWVRRNAAGNGKDGDAPSPPGTPA